MTPEPFSTFAAAAHQLREEVGACYQLLGRSGPGRQAAAAEAARLIEAWADRLADLRQRCLAAVRPGFPADADRRVGVLHDACRALLRLPLTAADSDPVSATEAKWAAELYAKFTAVGRAAEELDVLVALARRRSGSCGSRDPNIVEEAKRLLAGGMTRRKVARELGISYGALTKRLLRDRDA